jgi:hypothetical protein
MGANPILGVFLQWLGGLAAGSFYLPQPPGTRLVVGDLLARWRHGELGRHALGHGVADDTLATAGSAGRTGV